MIQYKNIRFTLLLFGVVLVAGCTKLNEKLNSNLTTQQVASSFGTEGTQLLLNGAYSDLSFLGAQDLLFSLEENSTDESLVPTRGGDWDDNGVWRVIHAHKWTADHDQITNVFTALNKINFDATNVLNFNPSPSQAAQAKVLRAYSLYYLMDLYGQYPIRNPGDNLLEAPNVRNGQEGIDSIINDIQVSLPDLPEPGNPNIINKDVAKTLLMHCYLQRGTFINRAAPTFDPADMEQVITLGNSIIDGHKYSFEPNYFDNFSPNNDASSEAIFAFPNTGGVGTNHASTEARWEMTLHYNSYNKNAPNAGWNGFSTISDFYNSFGATTPVKATSESNRVGGFFTGVGAKNNSDTAIDQRLGGRVTSNLTSTKTSGIRPGFLIGQQYDEKGVAEKDRKGNPLAFDPKISEDMKETGSNLEITGIRVIKYPPDYDFFGGPANNDLMIYRYSDVVLMVAEAEMRKAGPDMVRALELVNDLRTARGAAKMTSIVLVNPDKVEDPGTLLAERGRELYWESFRRTDLLRFGVFLKPWQYKTTDDPKNLVYPIPNQALAADPNLKQNPGY
ncbi:MAG: RagB/SusD family nutrient uptake outer membrane protein [Ginsengibacter sp.]